MLFSMEIDWDEIWRVHSPYYRDGKFYLELGSGKKIYFKPGPAFGDGSHATTNLMLESMAPFVKGKIIVDLGSGSGVLSMAASRLGAKKVFAYEIDEAAITTMRENLHLNKVANITINEPAPSFDVVLVNMISSEQKIAFEMNPFLKKPNTTYIVSGILTSEKTAILQSLNAKTLLLEKQDECWSLLIFTS
jgi:ribosomal protein L11 methyltransferase